MLHTKLSASAIALTLMALTPVTQLSSQAAGRATQDAQVTGDYVVRDARDGSQHTLRVKRVGRELTIQWDANTPTTLVPRGSRGFAIAADTSTRVEFPTSGGVANALLLISAKADTTRAERVASAQPGATFEGDDWPISRSGPLFDSLAVADSLLFDAFYVRCDAEATIAMYTEDAEFYHDVNGLKVGADAMNAFRNNCPRDRGLRREIVPGSVRVYNIARYGAVQLGRHRFIHASGETDGEAKFIQLWMRTPAGWRATKTISIDHRAVPKPSR